jgi:hypothetical protein
MVLQYVEFGITKKKKHLDQLRDRLDSVCLYKSLYKKKPIPVKDG